VIVSRTGKGVVPEDHPYAISNLWGQGNSVDAMLRKADAVLVFGTKLGSSETEDGAMRLSATLIRVDIDPEEVERNYRPSIAIVADARKTAEALNDALAAAGVSNDGWRPEEIAAARAKALESAFGGENAEYVAALRRAIPRDGILVNDTTVMSEAAAKHFPAYAPRTFLVPAGYLTLGFSMPAAIGAKIAQPDKVVVSIVGDGGFQFTMHELATAKQFAVGLPIVIFNDSTYTAVKMNQATRYDRRYIGVDLENPDFLMLAAAYGVPGVRANSPAELEAAITEASARRVPTIIDTPIAWTY
jgi:thiamine pyrophosphate-dependent acetolactate synthase large subunit-like protein